MTTEAVTKWKDFIKGDHEAYSWLYTNYVQSLYRYGLRFTSDTELIKDSIQELFTNLYRNRKNLSVPENVKVYLFISFKNNLLRALSRNAIFDYSDPETIPFSLEPTVEDTFIEKEEYLLQQDKISEVLSLLSPRQQEIIYYRYVQELSFDEICRLMDLNYQSAQNLIQRSLKKIRSAYGDISIVLALCVLHMEALS